MFEIKKIVTGFAYAKNGNVHNPKPYVRYDIFKNGLLIGSDKKLKDAKKFISDIKSGNI
jgi:hypothetical protein